MKGALLFLLFLILNKAEFKQNMLTQIEDMKDPILSSSPRALKSEASNALKYIMGISFNFGTKIYNKDYILASNKFWKFTGRLSTSCNPTLNRGKNSVVGVVIIQGGKIMKNELKELKLRLTGNLYNLMVERFNLDYIINNFYNKFKDVIPDGAFYFNVSLNLVEFEFVFLPKGKKTCDGKLIVKIIPFKKYKELSFDIDLKQLGEDIKKL